MDLLQRAQSVHREHFPPNTIQAATLCNIRKGACPEDCAYCAQSIRYNTGLKPEKLMPLEQVVAEAKQAKAKGATRFCMGAAWRSLKDRDLDKVVAMIKAVNDLGLETCVTLGMLTEDQAKAFAEAGLDFYNHNLDTSPDYYKKIITTRTYEDRLDTLEQVRKSGIKVCCGGIIGMGEAREDRVGLLQQLVNLPEHPQSVPINLLSPVKGTPLGDACEPLEPFELVRTIAIARLIMPKAYVRLSAGRNLLSRESQLLCFLAGANSLWLGAKLLVVDNTKEDDDTKLFRDAGIQLEALKEPAAEVAGAV